MLEIIGKIILGIIVSVVVLFIFSHIFYFIDKGLDYIYEKKPILMENLEIVAAILFGLPMLIFMFYCAGDLIL